jgi:hypothetical protein
MTVSKIIGYALIAAGLLVGALGLFMMSVNELGVLFGIFMIFGALVLLGLGAVAVKK